MCICKIYRLHIYVCIYIYIIISNIRYTICHVTRYTFLTKQYTLRYTFWQLWVYLDHLNDRRLMKPVGRWHNKSVNLKESMQRRERERGKKNTVDQCYREENEWKQEIKCTNEWHYAPLLRKYITEALRKSMIAKDLMEVINLYFWKGKKDSCSHQKQLASTYVVEYVVVLKD